MKRHMKFILLTFILGYFSVFWVECKPEHCKLAEKMDFEAIRPLTENVKADVFLDASYSMAGYVECSNSFYIRTLQILERALISGWPQGTRSFYKFGTEISRPLPREKILSAAQCGFYGDPNFRHQTRIEKVIDKARPENLTIIVTDLFQNGADVNLLITKLNEKFLKKEMALGVLGIKSEFSGNVCDFGVPNLNFSYSTLDKKKPEDFRPFYILMLGKYADVKHYYENMKINGLDSFLVENFIIFSPQLVEQLASFEKSNLPEIFKLKEVINIVDPHQPNYHIKQFVIHGNPSKAHFQIVIRLALLPYIVKFDGLNLKSDISALLYRGSRFEECEVALRGFGVRDLVSSGSHLRFTADIVPANFPGNGTYCFKIVVHPHQKSYSLPNWISDWDMDQNLIDQWRINPAQFKGNTTLNLKNFLNNIWQTIYQKYRPKITKLYCYVKKG